MPPSTVRSRSLSLCAQSSLSSAVGSPHPGGISTFMPGRRRSTAARAERRAKSRGISRVMISPRDPSAPRPGSARRPGRLRHVSPTAEVSARGRVAAGALHGQPQRDGLAAAVLPVLCGEPVEMRARRALLAMALVLLVMPQLNAHADDLACGQLPGNRFFWMERAFCELELNGPDRANGVIIWNHGMSGTNQSWMAPAPPVLRLLQSRGWDVFMLKRHHAAETDNALYRTVQRTLQEAAALKKSGYRKIVLAGQSFGGYATLEAVDTSPDIDAAIAFAPGVRSSGAGRLDPSIIERILQRAKVGRLALLFPKDDTLFGNLVRGESAQAILSRRTLPYLLLDETSGISGHGGGTTGRFALRYGLCLADFLAASSLPAGRFVCPPVTNEWLVVRELLLPPSVDRSSVLREASTFPEPVGSLTGLRWAVLEDTLVLLAPVSAAASGQLRLLYRSTGITSGVYDATVKDGLIRAVLSNKSTVTLKPEGDGVLTWTASDASRSLNAPLVRGGDVP